MLQKLQRHTVLYTFFICFGLTTRADCQNHSPVTWHFRVEPTTNREATLVITAVLAPGWHIYSQCMAAGGPLPTHFSFEKSDEYSLTGQPEEKSETLTFYDSLYGIDIVWLSKVAVFSQKVKLNAPYTTIRGKVSFMACTPYICLSPDEREFSMEVKPYRKP